MKEGRDWEKPFWMKSLRSRKHKKQSQSGLLLEEMKEMIKAFDFDQRKINIQENMEILHYVVQYIRIEFQDFIIQN